MKLHHSLFVLGHCLKWPLIDDCVGGALQLAAVVLIFHVKNVAVMGCFWFAITIDFVHDFPTGGWGLARPHKTGPPCCTARRRRRGQVGAAHRECGCNIRLSPVGPVHFGSDLCGSMSHLVKMWNEWMAKTPDFFLRLIPGKQQICIVMQISSHRLQYGPKTINPSHCVAEVIEWFLWSQAHVDRRFVQWRETSRRKLSDPMFVSSLYLVTRMSLRTGQRSALH